jgi:NAD(P)-dependent dehydrogenase (short-subunit alcohol dehydrogenase family)
VAGMMQGKVVVVTGAGGGIGREIAIMMAAAGARVIINDVGASLTGSGASETPAQQTQEVIRQGGGAAEISTDSVAEWGSAQRIIQAAIDHFGRIDAVVNNAGYGLFGVFERTPEEKVREQFEVNVFGVMNVVRAVLPHFRKNRRGRIVNVSSGAGVFALPMISLYTASKFALEGFSESLSYELAALGIGVKIVEPGGVTSTNFGSRSAKEAASPSSEIRDYDAFVSSANEVFASLAASRNADKDSTAEHVARIIYQATTDSSDQLRYVATSAIVPLVEARRQTSEREYMEFMRSRVTPKVK